VRVDLVDRGGVGGDGSGAGAGPFEVVDLLWRVAAVLTAPPVVALAAERHLGAGRSGDALKLAAREVVALPLPADGASWAEGAAAFALASAATDAASRATALEACARAMTRAYLGHDDPNLHAWWRARLPQRR